MGLFVEKGKAGRAETKTTDFSSPSIFFVARK